MLNSIWRHIKEERFFAFAAASTALLLTGLIIAQFGARWFFGFELLVSLLPQFLLVGIVGTIITLFWKKLAAIGLLVLIFVAGSPFVFFAQYGTPSGAECGPNECLRVLTINLWSDSAHLPALSKLALDRDIDLLAINEASVWTVHYSSSDRFFPQYETVVHASWLTVPRGMGNPISLFTRAPIADTEIVLEEDTGRRAYISADLGEHWDGVRVVIAHTMTPVTQSGWMQRNALIDHITAVGRSSEDYIVLGDFNLTPWSPKFHDLPGKRAGDPKFSMTWPTMFPLLGMTIDHIMFSDGLELVHVEVLPSIGSDHYPLMAVFKRKHS